MGNHETPDRYNIASGFWQLITMVYVFNFIDVRFLVILQSPSKQKLGLSDTARWACWLADICAAYIVIFRNPNARLADRESKNNLS